jgi:predicted ATPase/DNA-binding CsgD family transcriptional regulator
MERLYATTETCESYHRLPTLLTSTIGREHEISAVAALLSCGENETRLLTLTGPGGVGKTRLALAVARAMQADFPDGVCFISLAMLAEHEQVLATIARGLNIAEATDLPLLERLCLYLHTRRLLLILDNFEHLLPGALVISELLQATSQFKVLATSREALHLYGEYEYPVPPLPLPETISVPLGEQGAAIALFVERARAVRPSFTLSAGNQRAVAEICVHLDGLPLAIELAAARIKHFTAQEVLAYLEKPFRLLTGGARNLPPRQQSLRNTLDWSYNLLSENEKAFFRRLGVLAGNWTLSASARIAYDEMWQDDDPRELLTSLVDKSLVRVVEEGPGVTCFALLETIREYALECLHQENELLVVQRRHAHFYMCLAEEVEPHLSGREQQLRVRELDRESANLWAALRWTIEQRDTGLGLRLASALVGYWQFRGFFSEGRNWFEEILALPGADQESPQRARVLYAAGMAAHLRHELDRAGEWLEESCRLAEMIGERRIHALALGSLALLDLHRGDSARARTRAEEGVCLLDKTNDAWCRGILHRMCADIFSCQCDFENARVRYRVSLMLLREAGDLRNEMETLVNFAGMVRVWGRIRIANALYQRGLRLFRDLDDRRGQLVCLLGIGNLSYTQGSYERAQHHFEAGLILADALGDLRQRAEALRGLGLVALALGDVERTRTLLKESLRLSKEIADSAAIWFTLLCLGDSALNQQRIAEAGAYYEQCLALARKMDDKLSRARSLWGLGMVALFQHSPDYIRACALLKQSLHLCWEMDTKPGLISALEALAMLCRRLNQPERAALLLGIAASLRETFQVPLPPSWRPFHEQEVAAIRDATGEVAFQEGWSVGHNMDLRQTIGLIAHIHVPQVVDTPANEKPTTISYPSGLTAREVDVLRLLASGLTDARIAQQLVLSPRTVNTHLRSIYAKIGVSTRSAATRFAIEHGVVEF